MDVRLSSGRLRSTSLLLLALAFGACSSGSGGAGGATGGTTIAGTGGSGTGGATGTGGVTTTGTGGATTAGTGGLTGGTGGATGTGGAAATGGTTGTGTGGTTATGGAGGATATGGTTGAGGATASGFCPAGAIFCADFEEASGVPNSNPVGTATFEDPSEYGSTFGGTSGVMTLDSADMPYDGKQSLKVMPSSGFSIRTLAVTVPSTFWVRLYIKSDKDIGQPDHNSFFAAGLTPDYSTAKNVELSEQYNCVLLNASDDTYPPGTTCGANTALPANAWHCMTAEFDGTTGNVQVFAGSTQIINATAFAPAKEAFTTFSFGYLAYNPNSATVWYDDVVVSANPLSCP